MMIFHKKRPQREKTIVELRFVYLLNYLDSRIHLENQVHNKPKSIRNCEKKSLELHNSCSHPQRNGEKDKQRSERRMDIK